MLKWLAVMVMGLLVAMGVGRDCVVHAQGFLPETEVGDGQGMVVQSSLALDVVNAHITSVIDGKIYHRIYSTQSTQGAFITPEEIAGQGDPDSVASDLGQVFVIYTQEDTSGGVGREVIESRLSGGTFLDPENLSIHPNDEQSPRVARDIGGIFHSTWSRTGDPASEIVYYTSRAGGSMGVVAEGESPAIAVDETIAVHLIYMRDGDLLYQNNSSGAFAPENEVTIVDSGQVFSAAIGASALGKAFVTYETQGRLVLRSSTGGDFDTPRDVATGGVSGSSLYVSSDGRAIMAYSLLGDIHVGFDFPSSSPDPVQITETVEVESSPDVQVSVFTGDIHVIYLRDDRVYYTNNAEPPVAAFDADPLAGDAPLEVEFTDLSSGQIHTREWEFGDGGTSDETDPTHVYETAGDYTATLRVFGPGGMDETSRVISVLSKVDFMTMAPVETFVGQTGLRVPIFGTFTVPITAYTATGRFDPSVLSIQDVTLEFTYTSTVAPDTFGWFCDESLPGDEIFFVAAIFSDLNPMEGQGLGVVLPVAANVTLANLIVDIRDDIAPQEGPFLVLEDRVGGGNELNLYTALPQITIHPEIVNHPMTIRSVEEFDALVHIFRGDVDKSDAIDVTDAINLLDFLFIGRFPVTCLDLADFDDTGQVDVTDAINLLVYLFLGGEPPKPPWPEVGPDPTDDNLAEVDCEG